MMAMMRKGGDLRALLDSIIITVLQPHKRCALVHAGVLLRLLISNTLLQSLAAIIAISQNF